MMTEVKARTAEVVVRTVTITRALLKQVRVFNSTPPEQFVVVDEDKRTVVVVPDHAIGWFRGTVLGDEYYDYVLFAKDGDLYLGKFGRTTARWKMSKEVKQLYI